MALATLCGCSSRPAEYVLATGEFVWDDGAPVTGVAGLVRFSSLNERNKRASSTGELRSDGGFELSTYETQHGRPHKGLREGEYVVVLLEYDQQDSERVIPEEYRHFEESPWRATVEAERDNHFTLVVQRVEEPGPQ